VWADVQPRRAQPFSAHQWQERRLASVHYCTQASEKIGRSRVGRRSGKDGRERDSEDLRRKQGVEFGADPSLATLNGRAPTKECTLVVDNCLLGEVLQ
jgi:hypothetical protein